MLVTWSSRICLFIVGALLSILAVDVIMALFEELRDAWRELRGDFEEKGR